MTRGALWHLLTTLRQRRLEPITFIKKYIGYQVTLLSKERRDGPQPALGQRNLIQ
jgi:hypothetical protein